MLQKKYDIGYRIKVFFHLFNEWNYSHGYGLCFTIKNKGSGSKAKV